MFLFETILFYQGAPCFYNIYSKEDNTYYCEAQPHFYYSHIPFPNFTLAEGDDQWASDNAEVQDLKKQVVKDLEYFLQYS